jgi:AcrR family transcriptional regulator
MSESPETSSQDSTLATAALQRAPRAALPGSTSGTGGMGALATASAVAEPRNSAAEILRAAADAFMLKGFAATSTDDVAARLGCTKGRIYHHFRSKVDLFFAVHAEAMSMVTREVIAAGADVKDPIHRLFCMSRAHVLVIMREIAFQCVVVQGLEMHLHGQTTPQQRQTLHDILAQRDEYEQLFSRAIDEAIAAGLLPEQDTRVVVKALLGALNWTTLWYRPRKDEVESARLSMAEEVATFCIRGLGGKHGR